MTLFVCCACFSDEGSPGFRFVSDYIETLNYFQKNIDKVKNIFPGGYENRTIFLDEALKNSTLSVRRIKKSIRLISKYTESKDLKIRTASRTILGVYSEYLRLYEDIMDFQYDYVRGVRKFNADKYLFRMKEFKKESARIWKTLVYGPFLITQTLIEAEELKITPEERMSLIKQIDDDNFLYSIKKEKNSPPSNPETCRDSIRKFLVSGYKVKTGSY